eukprot:1008034-Amphidinium_carterae.1
MKRSYRANLTLPSKHTQNAANIKRWSVMVCGFGIEFVLEWDIAAPVRRNRITCGRTRKRIDIGIAKSAKEDHKSNRTKR